MQHQTSARGCLFWSVAIPVVVIGAFIGLSFLMNINRFTASDPDPEELAFAQPGDCIIGSTAGGQQSRWGSCDEPGATKEIRFITDHPCIDMPGVDMQLNAGRIYCLGDKDLDPATTVNGIVAGECTAEDGSTRQDTDGASRVIGGEAFAMCQRAGVQADRVYSFSLVDVGEPTPGQPRITRTHHDRSLCLSEVR